MDLDPFLNVVIPFSLEGHVEQDVTMGHLADTITTQVKVLEEYHQINKMPPISFNVGDANPPLLPHMPHHVRHAREQIVDSALRLLELAAGPSKMVAIACSQARQHDPLCYPGGQDVRTAVVLGSNATSQVQLISALNWLLHFRIFNIVSDYGSIALDDLADEAEVPVPELGRMLRMAMAHHIFFEHAENHVRHSYFSRMLAKDEDFLQGLPFFCNTVMPASAKIVETTDRWPDSQEGTETAHNLVFDRHLEFDQYAIFHNQTREYAHLKSLLYDGRRLSAALLAEVAHGSIDWSSLEKGALVVDLLSDSPCSLELAELFPHLQLEVRRRKDELEVLRNCVITKNLDLLCRIRFRSPNDPIPSFARVYLLVGLLHRKSNEEVHHVLSPICDYMDGSSRLIIVDSILSDPGDTPLAMKRMWQCRDMTMRQLHNSGDRTLSEVKELVCQASEECLVLESHTCRPGSTVATVVFRSSLW
ncbi:hypothetical protein J3F83DRAFT_539582 [Trichoderma novae-zelandiae]